MRFPFSVRRRAHAALAAGLAACATAAAPARAQTGDPVKFKNLHVFDLSKGRGLTGTSPRDLVRASDGNLYGVTNGGGAFGHGTFYRMTPDRHVEVLHDFGATADDGTAPLGAVVQASDGNFYGVTARGGASGFSGTVWRYASDGAYTVLHSFTDKPDAAIPMAGLVQASDGNLYGTTYDGGDSDWGAVFKVTLAGEVSVLHSFQAFEGHFGNAALIQGLDGLLYGTTREGGAGVHHAQGTVFSVSLAGEYTLLHSFAPDECIQPMAPLVQTAYGDLYGVATFEGAKGGGCLYRINPKGHFSVVHSFPADASDGSNPQAGLVDPADGYLYGTTMNGGSGGKGTVFRFALGHDGAETVLHEFDLATPGVAPQSALLYEDNGRFVGTADANGRGALANVEGTIFQIKAPH